MAYLPNDILLQVVQELSRDYQDAACTCECGYATKEAVTVKHTLLDLCLTSRFFCSTAQPALYRQFRRSDNLVQHAMEHRHRHQKARDLGFRRPTPTEKFIRTLIQRPDLARRVRHLEIADFYDHGEVEFGKEFSPLDPRLAHVFADACRRIPWHEDIRDGKIHVPIALLFTMASNLEQLEITPTTYDFGSVVARVWGQMLGPTSKKTAEHNGSDVAIKSSSEPSHLPAMFSSLHTIVVTKPRHSPRLHTSSIETLLTVPTLRHFHATGLYEARAMSLISRQLPLAHLETLRLDDCHLYEGTLITLLNSCGGLRELYLISAYPFMLGNNFIETLYKQGRNLETLGLTASHPGQCIALVDRIDFRRFPKLRALMADQGSLVPVDTENHYWRPCALSASMFDPNVYIPRARRFGDYFPHTLPSSLVTLCIMKSDIELHKQVYVLMAAIDGDAFPNLKRLNIRMYIDNMARFEKRTVRSDWRDNQQSCLEKGVKYASEFITTDGSALEHGEGDEDGEEDDDDDYYGEDDDEDEEYSGGEIDFSHLRALMRNGTVTVP